MAFMSPSTVTVEKNAAPELTISLSGNVPFFQKHVKLDRRENLPVMGDYFVSPALGCVLKNDLYSRLL